MHTVNFKVRPESVTQVQTTALTTSCLEALGQGLGPSSPLKPLPMSIKDKLFKILLSSFL